MSPKHPNPQDHPMFKQHPLNGKAALSCGEAPAPYHVYNGYGLFIGGACDLAAARELLSAEDVKPVSNTEGKALMAIWVCNFTEASLGPHHELQFSLFVSPREAAPLPAHAFSILSHMLTNPQTQMMCHGLWNNTSQVVAYNRELLSLNARQTTSRIERDTRRIEFTYAEQSTGRLIFSGMVQHPQQASLRANLAFISRLGLRATLAVGQQPWINMQVINPRGFGLDRNASARTCTSNDVNNVRYFDPHTDHLTFGEGPYRALNFMPQFVQYMDGFKMVYLQPE